MDDYTVKLLSFFNLASPQVALSSSGDCSFEDDACNWANPEENQGIDELNWERTEASKAEFRISGL